MDKHLIETESWLQEYRILEQRIESLYCQAQRPQLKEMFLRMGPRGDKNMAVDLDRINVQGGHRPVPWAVNLESVCEKIKQMSEETMGKIMACLAQQNDMVLTVERAGLSHEENLYVEQRYFLGMSIKEMERDGCMETRLRQIKLSALQKIYDSRNRTMVKAVKSGNVRVNES